MRYPQDKQVENMVDLESQFILRMPGEPARIIRELIQSGVTNFKDRMSIRLENDVRYGEVRVDHYLLHAKVVDLPTIIESLKTIDSKSFYKTADICQMMICKEEEEITTDEEAPNKLKKKDPNKVDKKFLYMHGIAPPLKNVRRRRYRKTLKKKFVEQPEIEKEVKRLLRIDNDAVSVKWEIIYDEDEQKPSSSKNAPMPERSSSNNYDFNSFVKKEETSYESNELDTIKPEPETVGGGGTNADVEQEIFGSAVSDSEDENINVMDIDESSRITGDDSRLYDSESPSGRGSSALPRSDLITEFSKDMFPPSRSLKSEIDIKDEPLIQVASSSAFGYEMYKVDNVIDPKENEFSNMSRNEILTRISELQVQLNELKMQQQQQEMELATIENLALRQRFQDINDRLCQEMYEKDQEIQALQSML